VHLGDYRVYLAFDFILERYALGFDVRLGPTAPPPALAFGIQEPKTIPFLR
jgi:hypothetical protein